MTIRTMSKIIKRTYDDKEALNRLNEDEVNLVNRMIKNRKTVASLRTIVGYINIVKRIYKIKGLTFNSKNVSFLTNNVDMIIEILNNTSRFKNSKDYLWAVINVLKGFEGTQSAIDKYKNSMGKKLKIDKQQRGENKKSDKQSANWMDYKDVIASFKKNKNALSVIDQFLLSLIINYPRRLADWYRMKLKIKDSKTVEDNINSNYLIINKHKVPLQFKFNRQKTSNYEEKTKEVPVDLKPVIYKYLKVLDVKDGELLFSNKSGNMYKPSDFSNKVGSLFKTVTGKRITSNLWRHIYIGHFGTDKFNLNDKLNTSSKMGHSFKTQQEYIKK